MFNISEKTIVKGLDKTGCTVGHIQHCITDKNCHTKPEYSVFNNQTSKGTQILHTKNGDFKIHFHEVNGWAKSITLEEIDND